ncbi:hypothetical protein, partial [Aeromonas caviae]|uniref:hypothetical protein n=1 Tax=Aeromonas caviae TaxID=648 RepID=UPI001F298B81
MKNIFFVTDNRWWFEQLELFFRNLTNSFNMKIFCSPKGRVIFEHEIDEGRIEIIDLKSDTIRLINEFDFGFSVHCKQIFPKQLVESIRCVNIHPGFNPHNRGWFPQVFSIINK